MAATRKSILSNKPIELKIVIDQKSDINIQLKELLEKNKDKNISIDITFNDYELQALAFEILSSYNNITKLHLGFKNKEVEYRSSNFHESDGCWDSKFFKYSSNS